MNLGYLYLLIAATLWGIFGIFTRLLLPEFSVYEQTFLRSLVNIVILVPFLSRSFFKNIPIKQFVFFLLFYLYSTFSFSFGIVTSNIIITVFCFYIGNISSSIILGKILLNEHISKLKTLSLVLLTIGLLIFFYDFASYLTYKLGIFLGLSCGLVTTLVALIRKQLPENYSNVFLSFSQAGIAFISTIPVLSFSFIDRVFNMNINYFYLIIAYGISNTLIQFFCLKGFETVSLNTGSVILTFEIVSACFFSWLIFNETSSYSQLLGCFLIFLAVLSLSLDKTES